MQKACWREGEHCALQEGLVLLRQEGAGRWGRGEPEGWAGDKPSCRALNSGSRARFILQGVGTQGEGSAGKLCGQCGQL